MEEMDRALPRRTLQAVFRSIDGSGNLFLAIGWISHSGVRSNVVYLKYPTMKRGKKYLHLSFRNWKTMEMPTLCYRSNGAPATSDAALDTNPTIRSHNISPSQRLAIGDICVLAVEFAPTSARANGTGILSVTSNATNSPLTINLSGTYFD